MRTSSKLGVVAALFLAAGMWFYMEHVLIPHQLAEAAANGIPRGNLSDLYPRWLGARELLLHQRDPYSSEITREIQTGYYGRPLNSALPNDPKDQQAFAYPLYVVFLLAPTITLPFSMVKGAFFWVLVAVTIATVYLWMRILQWSPSSRGLVMLIVLTLGSFQVLQGLKLQQLTLLVSGLIAGSIALLATGHLVAGGILLAFATIKPQLVLPLAVWLVLWATGDWRRRSRFVIAFVVAMAALILGADILLPGWIREFRDAMVAYRQYNQGALSVLQNLLAPGWGNILAVLVLLATVSLCWKLRRAPGGSATFNWITALVLTVTVLVAPKTSPYNHVLLLPGVLLAAKNCRTAWGRDAIARVIFSLSGFVLFWPWMAALALVSLSLLWPAIILANVSVAPVYTSLFIPVTLCLLLVANLRELAQSSPSASSATLSSPG